MKLSQLLAALPSYQVELNKREDPDITNITSNSRQVEPGALFVAYRGVNLDSYRFIPDAIARGAAAIVGEEAKRRGDEETPPHRLTASPPLITVPDGREALARYEAARSAGRPFSAVIMDLTIPNGMGGEDAVKQLKKLDGRARAIVSSGYSNDPVMAQYRRYGFDGIMPKPYQLNQLEEVLAQVLSAGTEPMAGEPATVNQELQLSL